MGSDNTLINNYSDFFYMKKLSYLYILLKIRFILGFFLNIFLQYNLSNFINIIDLQRNANQ